MVDAHRLRRHEQHQPAGVVAGVHLDKKLSRWHGLEFTQLQDQIKKDQDLALSLDSGLSTTFPGPPTSQAFELSHSAAAYPDFSSAGVKLEPLDFLDMDQLLMSPPGFSSMTSQQQAPGLSNL